MKYINIKYGLATGISIAIDENLSEDKIREQLHNMLVGASSVIMEELFIPIKERQARRNK